MNQIIATTVKSVRPDQPQAKGLCIVPILGVSHDRPPYRLLEGEAIQKVHVTEISEGGSVPNLKVVNDLEDAVFLMDGQELVGAKQNRILNTDVLVPGRTTITIPVSCVEAGRWIYSSPQFSPGKSASHRVRSTKHQRVHDSLKRGTQHDADQGAVWDDVQASLQTAGASSPSSALHAAYEQRQADLDRFRASLRLPEEAVGVAAFKGDCFAGLDLFDRHSTLRYFWESLVDSYAIDLLAEPVDPTKAAKNTLGQKVQRLLTTAAEGAWESFASPGLGLDWRLEDQGTSGSALVADDVVIHLQLFPRQQERVRRPRIRRRYAE